MNPRICLPAIIGLLAGLHQATAQTWTQTSTTGGPWNSIASSADGSELIAAGNAVYLSTNSGVNWISNNLPSQSLVSISADGTKMVVITSIIGGVTSTNSGTTWITNNLAFGNASLANSADGSKLISLGSSFGGYYSTNYGITWKSFTAPGNRAAISADGTLSYFVNYNSTNLYVSTNLGVTSSRIASPTNRVLSLAISADGGKLIAGTSPGSIYTSTNFGISWIQTITPVTNWFYVASSADGSRLIGAARASGGVPGPIYTSSDFGVTWVSNSIAPLLWSGVASSADGGELLAIYPNNIFISRTTLTPQINIAPTNGSLQLSWLIPSTNFVMQQSSELNSWSSVTDAPVLNLANLQNQLILPQTNSSGFYRLTTP